MRLFRYVMFTMMGLTLWVGSLPTELRAQAKSERVRFDTYDGVEIQGMFYPSEKGRKAPTVLMLHKLEGKSTEDGWDALAGDLQKEGYAVLKFDFRGHGGSTAVNPTKFWAERANQTGVRGAARAAKTISHKDFANSYLPYLVNDIVAAKTFLEKKNDAFACNVSNLILIGAEEGATLGMMWMASEAKRYKMVTPLMMEQKPQSKDIVGAIWLSPTTKLKRMSVGRSMAKWLREMGIEQRIPMAFVYGEEDKAADNAALAMTRVIKPKYKRKGKYPDKNNLTLTGDKGIDKTRLSGAKLLDDALETRKWIVSNYLEKGIRKDHAINSWEERKTDMYPYVWTNNPQILQGSILGKSNGAKDISFVPLRLVEVSPLGSR